jgi:crotonobetainyl-CoA:carnitine CoA-transferase CaiB-like acyl-CoA transferase
MATLLDGVRVLDLATVRAEITGRLLADLGAEVLKIEPPGGAAARRVPPFDSDDSTKPSLYWAAVGLGKQSAVLDFFNDAADRECLRELIKTCDVLVESHDPGALDRLGLGYADVQLLNPHLIYISITPYGQAGPKAHWPATDLTLQAAGGRVALQGDQDRPPLPVGYPHQAYFHAGVQAAADVIIALNERECSGLGQRLDTSMQECMIWSLLYVHGYPTHVGGDPAGVGDDRGTVSYSGISAGTKCADGYVLAMANRAQMANFAATKIVPALEREGILPDSLRHIDWHAFSETARGGHASEETVETLAQALTGLIATRTKQEWMDFATRNDLNWAAINTTRDLVESKQLAARNYWQKIGNYTHPGPHASLSRTPIVLKRAAPDPGQDQAKVYEWLADLAARNVPKLARGGARLGEAFAGLKVADFTWIATGPVTTKALADHGATVVKIESKVRPDFSRLSGPYRDNVAGLNRSFHYSNWNSSKLGLSLNLSKPEGKALARRVIDWADVVVDNYSAGTMNRLGFDYAALSRDHPSLIMLSSCLLGQNGPWARFSGGGGQGAAVAGFHAITGWPDRAATGPAGAYTDLLSARFSVAILAAAVLERRRSGLGQYIDMSQVEASMHFIEPLLLDQTVNGRTASAAGLASDLACPNGVYPVDGRERYIAISVETPQQWRALRSLAPLADFADERYDRLECRRKISNILDACIARWTDSYDRFELERLLASTGVPAAVVARPTDLQLDPQLRSRGFFLTLDHAEMGPSHYDGLATHFSAKREMLHKPAPCLGADTAYVLEHLLGLSQQEIARYAAKDVLI